MKLLGFRYTAIACLSLYIIGLGSCTLSGGKSTIPTYLTDAHERLDYKVTHYWDNIDLRDSTWIHKEQELQFLLEDYFDLISCYPSLKLSTLLKPLEHADGVLLEQILSYYQSYYLAKPKTSKNEVRMAHALNWASKSPKVRAEYQDKAQHELKELLQNQVGYKATNFCYQVDSSRCWLAETMLTDYRLIAFCTGDASVLDSLSYALTKSSSVQSMLQKQRLHVTYIYVGEGRMKNSSLRLDSIHPKWIEQGIDPTDSIVRHKLYQITNKWQAYLIAKNQTVLLKNPSIDELTTYLQNNE